MIDAAKLPDVLSEGDDAAASKVAETVEEAQLRAYPSKALILENGRYAVADHSK
jgi:hypothetical protein